MNIVLFAFCQTHFRPDYPLDPGRRQIETEPSRGLHLKSNELGGFLNLMACLYKGTKTAVVIEQVDFIRFMDLPMHNIW